MRCKSPAQADKILTAAARLFATHRFHEARMEDIAAVAEVGKGTLYRYFQDKEALYVALLHGAGVGLLKRLAPCYDTQIDPRRRLVLLVEAIIDYFDEQPHLFDLITHAEAMYRPGNEFPWQETRAATIDLTHDILRVGSQVGVFAAHEPELAALLLLGGLRAVIRFGPTPRSPELAEQMVSMFLGGYASNPNVTPAGQETRAPSRNGSSMSVIDAATPAVHNP